MVVFSLLALLGLVILTVAADHLVLGSSRLAARLRISPIVVGVVVIGLGTSAPEFLVSGVAAAKGDLGIATGNIIGSNILNVTLILGVAALVASVGVDSSVIRREALLSVVAVLFFAIAAIVGLFWVTGAILAVATVVALLLLLRWARRSRNEDLAREANAAVPAMTRPAWVEVVRSVAGLAGVLVGAQLLVANASSIAEQLGVPQVVIGVTLVALGTSLPELMTTIMAQRRCESDLVVGNLFGSNLFNSLAGGAIIGLADWRGSATKPSLVLLGVMVISTGIAWLLLRRGLRLTRGEGVVLLAVYLASLPFVLFFGL